MIGQLRGILLEKRPPELMLEVQGVGYLLSAPMSTFYQLGPLGEEVTLLTHMIIREDAHQLYAFATGQERTLFKNLLKINGIGPKIALAILSNLSTRQVVSAITENDVGTLVKVPGIGRKTAERLIIEMRDSFRHWDGGLHPEKSKADEPALMNTGFLTQEAISALIALGYKQQEAEKMIKAVIQPDMSCEDMIRYALRSVFAQPW